VATMRNSIISVVPSDSPEGLSGHTHVVTCKLCGEKIYGDSVRFFADWIKEHRCGRPTSVSP
jgi:hypothetical protein